MADITSLGIFAGVGAAIALCWQYIKMVWDRIFGIVVMTIKTNETDATAALSNLLWQNFTRSAPCFRTYCVWNRLRRSTKTHDYFLFESLLGGTQVFWRGWRPVLVVTSKDDSGYPALSLKYIRGMFDSDELMREATALYAKRVKTNVQESRFKVLHLQGASSKMSLSSSDDKTSPSLHRDNPLDDVGYLLGYRPLLGGIDDIGEAIEVDEPMNCLSLSDDVAEGVASAMKWFESKDWYERKRIPWRRGWLLHGPPGNGKTSLARAIAQKLRIPIVVFDLSTMDNTELEKSWSRMMEETPCVALFEDFDNVFHGRKNVTAGEDSNALTFDAVLNAISGVKQANGVFLIVTTNDVEKIDEALGVPKDGKSSRPGRLDECFYLDNPCSVGRRRIASRILADCPHLIAQTCNAGAGDSGAQFQHRCEMVALNHHWNTKHADTGTFSHGERVGRSEDQV